MMDEHQQWQVGQSPLKIYKAEILYRIQVWKEPESNNVMIAANERQKRE